MIWVIGNKGMLGTELSKRLERAALPFVGTGREVDITDFSALVDFVQKQSQPVTWIINCAAYTAVDKAEEDRENCRLVNADGSGNIARVAGKTGAMLTHISTDYVFNGQGNKPYTEEDITDPVSVYGLTKRNGETGILEEHEKSYILRTAWLYGKHGKNFVHTMLRLMNEQESVSVVSDQRGSPTWARDLAETIITFVRRAAEGKTIPYGIYHYTNEGETTWFDFAGEIYRQGRELGYIAKDCAVRPCNSSEFPSKVKRPAYSVLDKTKIQTALGIRIPPWNESLRNFLRAQ